MARGFTHESTSNVSVEYYTPEWLHEALGLEYDLDPCSPLAGPVPWSPARRHYTIEDDGLKSPWVGRVFCNPPYGLQMWRWLEKMDTHRNGMFLIFARTDTDWFHRYVARADAILFLEKRIRFVNREGIPYGSPGSGSMLVAWGPECVEALERNTDLGLLVRP